MLMSVIRNHLPSDLLFDDLRLKYFPSREKKYFLMTLYRFTENVGPALPTSRALTEGGEELVTVVNVRGLFTADFVLTDQNYSSFH